jgi:hypothetical protein
LPRVELGAREPLSGASLGARFAPFDDSSIGSDSRSERIESDAHEARGGLALHPDLSEELIARDCQGLRPAPPARSGF